MRSIKQCLCYLIIRQKQKSYKGSKPYYLGLCQTVAVLPQFFLLVKNVCPPDGALKIEAPLCIRPSMVAERIVFT